MAVQKETTRVLQVEAFRWRRRDTADDAYRCGHPRGGLQCTRMQACGTCPFAEVLDVQPAEAA